MAQTGDKISSLAGRYANVTADELLALTASDGMRRETAWEIRRMAASLLRQDETKGVRGIIRKVFKR